MHVADRKKHQGSKIHINSVYTFELGQKFDVLEKKSIFVQI